VTFTTPEFLSFFLVFFSAWWALRGTARKLWLLGFSYLFYGSWSLRFLALLVLSTCVDFLVGLKLGQTTDPKKRKLVLGASLCFNLGILGFFKYFNFFVDSAHALLAHVGVELPLHVLHIVLPIGISFYTFQALSYTIDVYRGVLAPTRSLLDFATFVAAFPQLVAGPIERARRMLPQVAKLGTDATRADYSGFLLIALGAFKKAVIADNVALYANQAYGDVANAYSLSLWLGTYAFAIQIYCDFSGYSDIAIGLGRLIGLDIQQNFRAPYAARGPRDFLTRWHISLSTWLRDYLYIPLGGNRGTQFATMRNLMITMLLGGLWHGAAWNYVLWGFYHGALLIIGRAGPLQALGARIDALQGRPGKLVRTLQCLAFFHVTCLGWALFRASSLADCATLVRKLLGVGAFDLGAWLPHVKASGEAAYLAITLGLGACVVLAQMLSPIGPSEFVEKLRKWPVPMRFGFAVTLLYAAAIFSPEAAPPFIYFQF
jgi:D-alanyl-lipoteichoic acid acyltransferase DltB (MBOAT superfamily)